MHTGLDKVVLLQMDNRCVGVDCLVPACLYSYMRDPNCLPDDKT